MRRLIYILGVVVTCGLLAQQGPQPRNGLVAIVNDKVITWEDIKRFTDQELEVLYSTYARQPEVLESKVEQLRKDALDLLIERQLILHEFGNSGLKLPEAYIEDAIKRDIRDNYGDRLRLIKELQAKGLRYEDYRQRVRERIIVGALTAKNVAQEIIISPYKIERYYETNLAQFKLPDRVKLHMITLDKRKHGEAGARALANEVLKKLADGVPFAEMAAECSDDPQRREGGSRGWVERGSMREDLSKEAFSLKSGERSQVIDRPEACYVMWAEESSVAHTQPLSEVRERIEVELQAAEQKRLRQQWIKKLRAKQFVRMLPGL